MEKYVTVVSVDDHNVEQNNNNSPTVNGEKVDDDAAKSQFITVLSINDDANGGKSVTTNPETVLVYRLPGERLGFGLKFQGGTKNNEKIQRLFIQSCAENSPASRVQASWGFLREGDEILEIDGVSVTKMTRIECVKCLKDSNVAIKLLVRNGEGKIQNFFDENSDVSDKKSTPPPPPPVPPRKLNKRKVEQNTELKSVVEVIQQPPDAEIYSNLFSEDINDGNFRETESDDTASTISTVIDKYSICSSLSSDSDFTISQNSELAKALKPFTMLEKEFNLDNKLDNCLLSLQPPISFQDEINLRKHNEKEYENVVVKRLDENKNYENVVIKTDDSSHNDYENVDLKLPPRPLPRQALVEPKKRQNSTTNVIPPPRLKASKTVATAEFNTIQTWLQEATEVIHECALVPDVSKEEKVQKNNENLPRLIDFHPKISSPIKPPPTVNNNNEGEEIVVKKCIKLANENENEDGGSNHTYIESSSDEDEEKVYEPAQMERHEAFDTYSDEDGEKLGPPEIVGGGPSEAYFNFHWASTLLPTIGEVEEEFSSLEHQQSGPIVIINTADETFANDNNNNRGHNIIEHINKANKANKPAEVSSITTTIIVPAATAASTKSTKVFLNNNNDGDNVAIVDNSSDEDKVISEQTTLLSLEMCTNSDADNEIEQKDNSVEDSIEAEKQDAIVMEALPEKGDEVVDVDEKSEETVEIERIILGVEDSDSSDKVSSVDEVDAKSDDADGESAAKSSDEDVDQHEIEESTNLATNSIMDSMNVAVSNIIPAPVVKNTPPAFSRLPPDGHEFPPNFSEPITIINTINKVNEKHSSSLSYDEVPDLPKSNPPPPPVPRKVYRQDLLIKMDENKQEEHFKKTPFASTKSYSMIETKRENFTEQRRRSVDIHEFGSAPRRVPMLGSNWRKDEKSEKSVRDKIAMFSNGESDTAAPATPRKSFSKDFTKSSENLLSVSNYENILSRRASDSVENYSSLRKKALSVENLDEVDKSLPVHVNGRELVHQDLSSYKAKFSLETSKPVILGRAFSVESLNNSYEQKIDKIAESKISNPKYLGRTTSFSGYSNNNNNNNNSNNEERRRSSITNLLEQRKKSMSKLRGLVIPEKVPEAEAMPETTLIGLPIIKSKDSEKILSSKILPKIPETAATSYTRKTATLPASNKGSSSYSSSYSSPKPSINELGGTYKSIFRNLNGNSAAKAENYNGKSDAEDHVIFRKPLPPVPPAKPPRTSLSLSSKSSLEYQKCQTTEDESDDSDSVLSSRISSPPISPVVTSTPEKYVLTRTLSSETNTSIASSNSTLTSSSGSQASCSSVGSTPAIDMSRRISKSSSNEMSMNRKNVLASAKCRNGRGDLKIDESGYSRQKRYEDGDSTDGYEEEERKFSKTKPKLTNGANKANGFDDKEIVHYKVVDKTDSLVDKVIKVASYVEVVSDLEDNLNVETEIIESAPIHVEKVQEKKAFASTKSMSVDDSSNTMTDLAKWVRHEAAKSNVGKEAEVKEKKEETKKYTRSVSEQIVSKTKQTVVEAPVPRRELRSSVDSKKMNLTEIRKSFESKSNSSSVVPSPVKTVPKENKVTNNHDRFSSWDSLASSSSGVSSLQTNSLLGNAAQNISGSSQTLQSTPSDYGSFSSLGSSHSLITPQDLQLIIEEADPPLQTPEAFVVVLQRETPESSIGITLAGGSDYEAKEITIHKILTNSPTEKDGRLKRGDRILSINGLSMRGLTHRESLTVLKTPRPEVVMVVTRSKSLVVDILAKSKRPSLGSLSSLAEKSEIGDYERKMKNQHKASRSLDLDLDIVSNEESVFDGTASEDGLLSADESKCSSLAQTISEEASEVTEGSRTVELAKDGAGLGFSIEGGFDSPTGNRPLIIKKIFMGGAAEKSGKVKAGEEIVSINDLSIEKMTRIEVWNMMKKLPQGVVKLTLK